MYSCAQWATINMSTSTSTREKVQLLGEVFEGTAGADMATAGAGRELVFGEDGEESGEGPLSVAEAEGLPQSMKKLS